MLPDAKRIRSNSFLAAAALAIATSLPTGAQTRIMPRMNMPGERLFTRHRKHVRVNVLDSVQRVEAAEAKRTRKNLKRLRDAWRAHDNYHPFAQFV